MRCKLLAFSLCAALALVVSTQVINETCVNLLRKAAFPEEEIQRLILAFYEKCNVVDVDVNTLLQASQLRERYSFSFWDSLIVASALVTNCDTLYRDRIADLAPNRLRCLCRLVIPTRRASSMPTARCRKPSQPGLHPYVTPQDPADYLVGAFRRVRREWPWDGGL